MENNPYNLIHFAGDDYEKMAVMNIVPKPETIIRVMMLTQALDYKITFPLQDLTPLKKTRKGYTAIVWGGSVIKKNSRLRTEGVDIEKISSINYALQQILNF